MHTNNKKSQNQFKIVVNFKLTEICNLAFEFIFCKILSMWARTGCLVLQVQLAEKLKW